MAETRDVARAAEAAGVDAEVVRGWLAGDAEFLAGLNRARSERADQLRSEFRSLADEALAALRELVTSHDAPAAVRLRASLAVLRAVDATRAEKIGPTSVAELRAELEAGAVRQTRGLSLRRTGVSSVESARRPAPGIR